MKQKMENHDTLQLPMHAWTLRIFSEGEGGVWPIIPRMNISLLKVNLLS